MVDDNYLDTQNTKPEHQFGIIIRNNNKKENKSKNFQASRHFSIQSSSIHPIRRWWVLFSQPTQPL